MIQDTHWKNQGRLKSKVLFFKLNHITNCIDIENISGLIWVNEETTNVGGMICNMTKSVWNVYV